MHSVVIKHSPRVLIVGFFVTSVLTAAVGGAAMAAAGGVSRGPIPPEAFRAQGLDLRLVPDYVQVVDREGHVVGYVPKNAALGTASTTVGPDGRPQAVPVPVVGDDLKTVVGHMIPDKGFVPDGIDPNSVPSRPLVQGPGT